MIERWMKMPTTQSVGSPSEEKQTTESLGVAGEPCLSDGLGIKPFM
jgi:hypothetical protein